MNSPIRSSPPIRQESWTSLKRRVRLANDLETAYVELGRAAASPLLLVHGYTDNSRS